MVPSLLASFNVTFTLKTINIPSTNLPFTGKLTLPGDKSISHRAAILASIAKGTSRISGFLESEDCLTTIAVLQKLGVAMEHPEHGVFLIHGKGGLFLKPSEALDCKNSGTTLRLLAGVLAAQPFSTTLIGDDSLSRRPMKRIIDPLSAMGATLRATGTKEAPPLTIQGGRLHPIDYKLPISSAQVKSATMLAALFTTGTTRIMEPTSCRDHTERMLTSFQGTHRELSGETENLRKERDELSAQFATLTEQLKTAEQKAATLQAKEAELQQLQPLHQATLDELTGLRSELSQANQRAAAVEAELSALRQERDASRSEIDRLQHELHNRQAVHPELEREIARLNQELTSTREAHAAEVAKLQAEKADLASLRDQLAEQTTVRTKLEQELSTFTTQRDAARKRIEKLQAEIDELSARPDIDPAIVGENETLKTRIAALEQQLQASTDELAALRQSSEGALNQLRKESTEAARALQENLTALQAERDALGTQLTASTSEATTARERIQKLEAEL
ncbi:hypothetical protein EBZ37_09225, partial [bacterium]|nr:hypothetical protein [bacterium]